MKGFATHYLLIVALSLHDKGDGVVFNGVCQPTQFG
jgi:hypothetical protein